jgi:hypothetical protein
MWDVVGWGALIPNSVSLSTSKSSRPIRNGC